VYSYSCSRGAFMGMSIDGTVTHTRANANLAFYGRPLTAKDLLLGGSVDAPPAARSLYNALDKMINSFAYSDLQRNAAQRNQTWLGASGTAQLQSLAEEHSVNTGHTEKGGSSTARDAGHDADFGSSSTVIVPPSAYPSLEHGDLIDAGRPAEQQQAAGQVQQLQANLLGASQVSVASGSASVVQDTRASVVSRGGRSDDDGHSLYDLFD
jgi:hypothetical protein